MTDDIERTANNTLPNIAATLLSQTFTLFSGCCGGRTFLRFYTQHRQADNRYFATKVILFFNSAK